MIEIKEMRSLDEVHGANQRNELQDTSSEQTMRLQYLFQKLIKEAVAANNEEMAEHLVERITENVKEDVCKELDYQFRLMEERDEERTSSRHAIEDKRNEDYYKRIDELLRQYSGKNAKLKDKGKEKTKDKTITFPNLKAKEERQKKSFICFVKRWKRNKKMPYPFKRMWHFFALHLSLLDRACRTGTCARTAIDALICVDLELAVAHADCANWALTFTCTTCYTSIRNLECHNTISSLKQ